MDENYKLGSEFLAVGIGSIDDLFEVVNGERKGWKVLREENAGYEDMRIAMKAFSDRYATEARELLISNGTTFIVWQMESVIGDDGNGVRVQCFLILGKRRRDVSTPKSETTNARLWSKFLL